MTQQLPQAQQPKGAVSCSELVIQREGEALILTHSPFHDLWWSDESMSDFPNIDRRPSTEGRDRMANCEYHHGWLHTGEDWYLPKGETAGMGVYAAAAREVVFAGSEYPGLVVATGSGNMFGAT